ncbi:hypothetical protein KP509_26G029500 [Ceratopteris richardii]|uniref:BHLH domain-containing protein n=1 Tax=Ceratopteris richardii TaxID=49495 RepID=A0A8T2RL87_CERRI|nr:hypothetical protein KP509_26G029500 [Ceratopteris richardii]
MSSSSNHSGLDLGSSSISTAFSSPLQFDRRQATIYCGGDGGNTPPFWSSTVKTFPPTVDVPCSSISLFNSNFHMRQPSQAYGPLITSLPKDIGFSDLLCFNDSQILVESAMNLASEENNRAIDVSSCGTLSTTGEIACPSSQGLCSNEASKPLSSITFDQGDISQTQAPCYRNNPKAANLFRSLTYPPIRHLPVSCSTYAASSPLPLTEDVLSVHGDALRGDHHLATGQCYSFRDPEEESKAEGVEVKFEKSDCEEERNHSDFQHDSLQHLTGVAKSAKQSRKRGLSNASLSNVKAPRTETPPDVVHVRARRGQATDSHSLAERVRREKISQRMKVLQEIVPGCHKVLGKAMMLDEIINYVKSLQRQVEFLSMKLAVANQAAALPTLTYEGDVFSSTVGIQDNFCSTQFEVTRLDSLVSAMMQ